jgi:hypothetical protein
MDHVTDENWFYQNYVSAEASAGWGRVRDASAVYEAHVLEQRLLQTGALLRPPSEAARQRLVALLAVRDDYEAHRERPVKKLWQRIEEILTEDGALREGGLDAWSILRAGESPISSGLSGDVLPRSPFARTVGGFVGPLFTDQHSHFIGRIDHFQIHRSFVDDSLTSTITQDNHVRIEDSNDDPSLGARAEIHHPLGMRWQADASSRVLFPIRRNREGFLVSGQGALAYMVADRWVVTTDVVHMRSLQKGKDDQVLDDFWTVAYGIDATYYLEDDLQLSLLLREEQSRRTFSFDKPYQRNGLFILALSYRILGRFAAPGVIERETIRGH